MDNKLNYTNFLYCYDIDLSKHFKSNGIDYIIKARSIKDGKTFTMYKKSDELYDVMRNYNSSSN